MPRNSIITEGFTSNSISLITEGWADLQEIAIIGAGTLILSGSAITQRIITDYIYSTAGNLFLDGTAEPHIFELNYIGSGNVVIDGIAESSIEFNYLPTGKELLLSGEAITERIVGNIYYPSGQIITINGIAQTIAADYKYATIATGQIVVSGTVDSTIEFSYTPTGEELFLSGISTTNFNIDLEYQSSGFIELNGVSFTELSTANYINIPTGQTITLDGEGSTYIHDLHYYYNPATGKILITGIATSKFSKFLDFLTLEETEEIFNYASSLTNPQFQKEIRGGRAAILEPGRSYEDIMKTDPGCDEILQRERIVVASAFSSKDGIKGIPNFGDKEVNKTDFDSKEKIKGIIKVATDDLNYFDKYKNPIVDKKHKPKRTGREDGYNYEDEMFKK